MSRVIVRSLSFLIAAGSLAASGEANDRGPFDGLRFRAIGPASAGGRIDDFAVLETNPRVFYVATATAGLWKTTNNGTTFEVLFEDETTSSIGDVAVPPADPNLVWVGTGENNNRQSSSWGDGVYKSTDGGKTWKNMGLEESRHIARIVIDPLDHDVVYVAALGSLWGPGGERGVYKTEDGGDTWTRVLHVDDDTGATELVMDPRNPSVLYAATYQRRRAAWGFNGGGPGSRIYKTADGGRSWTELTNGIPEGPKGRIGLDVYRKNPDVLYARIEHPDEAGVYRSDDAGASWRKVSSLNPRPMYFSQIRIDPEDDQRVYVLGVQLHVSDDGGKTFHDEGARNIHVDFHAMWIDPANPNHLLLGGDGGVAISYDRSETWVFLPNMPLGQFYHVSYDMNDPYTICGGLQDNNTWCGPSAVRSRAGIANDDWFIIGGGDGFVALVDPEDPRVMYSESQNGRMNRVDRVTNERQSIRPEPAEGEPKLRWNWDTPLLLSPHDPQTVFVAAQKVFRSSDRGYTWEAVSPDLTTNADREEMELMGVHAKDFKIAKHDGVSDFSTLVSFAESPLTRGLYWAGSDDGLVHVSADAGESWTNVTGNIPGLPAGTYVSRLAPSQHAASRVYATFDGHRRDDFGTYVYASEDRGTSWTSLAAGLPPGEVARTITEDPRNPDVLYVGTERGLYVTTDRGREWHRLKANLPTVPIYEIAVHPRENDLLLATHGRSIWVLDDLAPIQEYAKAKDAPAHLFPVPKGATRNAAADRMREFEGDRIFLGESPPPGAVLTYHLAADAENVRIVIEDASGALVREISGEDTKGKHRAGMNQVSWDLRLPPLPEIEGRPSGSRFFGPGLRGPFVLPGTYRARLEVDGEEVARAAIELSGDPEIEISEEDRRAHHEAARQAYELGRTAHEAANAVLDLHERLGALKEAVEKAENAPDEVSASIEELSKVVEKLRRRFGVSDDRTPAAQEEDVRGDITRLRGALMGATARPTATQSMLLSRYQASLPEAVSEVNGAVERMAALYKSLGELGLFPAPPQPVGAVTRQ